MHAHVGRDVQLHQGGQPARADGARDAGDGQGAQELALQAQVVAPRLHHRRGQQVDRAAAPLLQQQVEVGRLRRDRRLLARLKGQLIASSPR